MKGKIENYWNTYQEINEWIKFSDTKAGIIVTVYGVLLTIIYTNSNNVYNGILTSKLILVLTIICAVLSILSIFFAFKCLNPDLKNDNTKSAIYFGHIALNKSHKEYLKSSEEIFEDTKNMVEQLSEQVYVNSKIAWKKFNNVTMALRFFFASMISMMLIIIIYFIK